MNSKWLILIFVAIVVVVVWRWQMFSSRRVKTIHPNNREELARSLNALIDYLAEHNQTVWATSLREIQAGLQDPAAVSASLAQLNKVFGGMGSLNDVVLGEREADEKAGQLMDAVFRDMKLYYGTASDRAEWKRLEDLHKDDLPQRIKNAFAK